MGAQPLTCNSRLAGVKSRQLGAESSPKPRGPFGFWAAPGGRRGGATRARLGDGFVNGPVSVEGSRHAWQGRRAMSTRLPLALSSAVVLSLAVGCGDDAELPDAGSSDVGRADLGASDLGIASDLGTPDAAGDAGPDRPDPDAGGSDAEPSDLGPSDVGVGDAGVLTGSQLIGAVRLAPDGVVDLPLREVYVTYLKPAVGLDPAGFFVQAEASGPALFVAATASVAVGDQLSLRVTRTATQDAQRRATEIADLIVESRGFDVTPLSQDLSASSDVVSRVGDYESELVVVSATIAQAPSFGGTGHTGMDLATDGLQGEPNFELRIPQALQEQLGLERGCVLTVAHTPLWRFNAKAQVSAWRREDFAGILCSPTALVSAVAPSSSEVVLTFSRALDPDSLVDPASQIVFDHGLLAVDAQVDGAALRVTTSAQSPGEVYTASVGAGLLDVLGQPVEATASFDGYLTTAQLALNELGVAITNGCDLVELRAIEGGTVAGYTLRERTSLAFSLPGLVLRRNDLVVLHFNSGNASCRSPGIADETTGPAQYPSAAHPLNFDGAYDLYTSRGGLTMTNNVFTLLGPGGVIVDAVFATSSTVGPAANDTNNQAATVANAGQWEMVGGGVPSGGFVNDSFHPHAVFGLDASNRVLSLQRISNQDTNTKADWTATATTSSWGQINAGQVEF